MTVLSITQVAEYAYAAGFRGDNLIRMVAIIGRESGRNTDPGPSDVNNPFAGCRSWGLAQINTCPQYNNAGIPWREKPETLLDPMVNLRAAFEMSKGGVDFGPWTTYRTGIAPADETEVRAVLKSWQPGTAPTPENIAKAQQNAKDAAKDAVEQARERAAQGDKNILELLTEWETWRRVLYIVSGTGMVVVGIMFLQGDRVGSIVSGAAGGGYAGAIKGAIQDTDADANEGASPETAESAASPKILAP